MFIIYDLIFFIFALAYLPAYLFRGKFHKGFFARLGFVSRIPHPERPIWIHAVSVGEVVAVRSLIDGLRNAYPQKKFVISTVTPTGNRIARDIARGSDFVTYLPLDLSFIVKRVIGRINPSLFIIAETEIWPNLISSLSKKDIPVVIVNGRISDASFRGYSLIKFLLRPLLNKISLFCVQGIRDAERFRSLGAAENKIKVTGNMKFDNTGLPHIRGAEDLRSKLGLREGDRLLVAGSTHFDEEGAILDIYKDLLSDFSDLKLLIAPRHPQRSKDIAGAVSGFGFRAVFISGLTQSCPTCIPSPVFILDIIGQLIYFYDIAQIVFVGGSLVKKGGHNILEPASLGKPILFGPHMFNFRDIAELFIKNKAAIMVDDKEQLRIKIKEVLKDDSYASRLSRNARDLIRKNSGSAARNLEFIKKLP